MPFNPKSHHFKVRDIRDRAGGGEGRGLLTSQLLIKSPTRSHRQGLDELGELDASVLQGDKEAGVVSL